MVNQVALAGRYYARKVPIADVKANTKDSSHLCRVSSILHQASSRTRSSGPDHRSQDLWSRQSTGAKSMQRNSRAYRSRKRCRPKTPSRCHTRGLAVRWPLPAAPSPPSNRRMWLGALWTNVKVRVLRPSISPNPLSSSSCFSKLPVSNAHTSVAQRLGHSDALRESRGLGHRRPRLRSGQLPPQAKRTPVDVP
jgi:hypothetical protein